MTSNVKTPPQDKHAELFVLGAMLNSINAVNYCVQLLNAQDFYYVENQAIFQGIFELYSGGFSVSVENVYKTTQNHKFITPQLLISLSVSSSSVDCEYYCKHILNLSRLRKLIAVSENAMNEAFDQNAESIEIITSLQNKLFQAQGIGFEDTKKPSDVLESFQNGRSFSDHAKWVHEQTKRGQLPYVGVSSGYPLLDKTLGYFRPGCYYTIGARTSMGKTTFLLNLLRNMNSFGRQTSVGFFSLEMPAEIILAKLLCLYACVKYSTFDDGLCTPEELGRILSQAETIKNYPIFIEDQSGITISAIRNRAKRMKQNFDIQVLFIDYLTLIRADGKHGNNHLAVNEISKGIQALAKELAIPIIVLAQINRSVVGRTDRRPTMADFRESGSIEEDSDACLMLHRPEYFDPNDRPGVTELQIAKNRIRGQIRRLEFHMPYGEVYQELETIQEGINKASQESVTTFKSFFEREDD